MTVEGVEHVMLALVEYERLDAYRRQVGALTAQSRALKQVIADTNLVLDAIAHYLDTDEERGGSTIRHEIRRLLEARPGHREGA
jgi:hypothetical protein